MFEPRIPTDVVIRELRAFCDEKALFLLTRHIEGEAGTPDMILTSDQKRYFVDLWFCAAMCVAAAERHGPAQELCLAANRAATKASDEYVNCILVVERIREGTRNAEDRGQAIFNQLLDQAFGAGAFDHSVQTKAFAGAELGACTRYAAHLMKTHKIKI